MKQLLCYLSCTAHAFKNYKGDKVAAKIPTVRKTPGQRKEDPDEADLSSSTDSSDSEPLKTRSPKRNPSPSAKQKKQIGKITARYVLSPSRTEVMQL